MTTHKVGFVWTICSDMVDLTRQPWTVSLTAYAFRFNTRPWRGRTYHPNISNVIEDFSSIVSNSSLLSDFNTTIQAMNSSLIFYQMTSMSYRFHE